MYLYGQNIYILDQNERKRFANDSHEYLIQQLQYVTEEVSNNIEINFNHPVKELIWIFTNTTRTTEIDIKSNIADPNAYVHKKLSNDGKSLLSQGTETVGGNDYFNYNPSAGSSYFIEASKSGSSMFNGNYNEHFDTFTLELNGHDRFEKEKRYILEIYNHIKLVIKDLINIFICIHLH